MHQPNRPYHRYEIDLLFKKTKAQMQQKALIRGGDGRALYTDCYTGNTLRGGDRYDYEHIISSEEIFMTYRDRLTNHAKNVSNHRINIALTKNAAARADRGIQQKVKDILSR